MPLSVCTSTLIHSFIKPFCRIIFNFKYVRIFTYSVIHFPILIQFRLNIFLWELAIAFAVTEHFTVSCIRLIYLLHYSIRWLNKINQEKIRKESSQAIYGLAESVNCVRHLPFTGKWSHVAKDDISLFELYHLKVTSWKTFQFYASKWIASISLVLIRKC